MFGKITGTLDAKELEQWKLLQEQPEVVDSFQDILRQLPADAIQDSFNTLKQPGFWKETPALLNVLSETPSIHQLPVRKISAGVRWAAAAILIVVASGILMWRHTNQGSQQSIAFAKTNQKVQLKMQDGQVIDLSDEAGTINTGLAQLKNVDNSLAYSVGADTREANGLNTLIVPPGLDYKILLNDGSEVWLNAATQLEFPLVFKGNTREIKLNGEAYIKVASKANSPFIVHLPNSSIQVLGTTFNVNTYDSTIARVSLVEGAVNLQTPTELFKLAPGKEAIYKSGASIVAEAFNERKTLSWRKGLLYFEEAGLEEIGKVMERWYGIDIKVEAPSLLNRKFTGVLNKNQPISVFLEDLKIIAKINSSIDRNGVLHFN